MMMICLFFTEETNLCSREEKLIKLKYVYLSLSCLRFLSLLQLPAEKMVMEASAANQLVVRRNKPGTSAKVSDK